MTQSAMYLLGFWNLLASSNGLMWRGLNAGVGPLLPLRPSPPWRTKSSEGREGAQHQVWPMQRGPQGSRLRAPASGRSWQEGSSWTLTLPRSPPASFLHLPCPSQVGWGWSVSAALLDRACSPRL